MWEGFLGNSKINSFQSSWKNLEKREEYKSKYIITNGKNTLFYPLSVKSKRLRARRPNLQCWLCTMSLVHGVGGVAVSLWATDLPHTCFRCHRGESSLFLLIFHILRGSNFCCGLKLSSYNIKVKPNRNYKILLAGLVWFFNRVKSDSPHNCCVKGQILGLCTS